MKRYIFAMIAFMAEISYAPSAADLLIGVYFVISPFSKFVK